MLSAAVCLIYCSTLARYCIYVGVRKQVAAVMAVTARIASHIIPSYLPGGAKVHCSSNTWFVDPIRVCLHAKEHTSQFSHFAGLTVMTNVHNTHTHPFNGPLSGSTRVSQYRKGKTNLDFTEARDSEWQWHQLGHMQVCTSLQTDNHASTTPLRFLQAGCPPAAQPTASKH